MRAALSQRLCGRMRRDRVEPGLQSCCQHSHFRTAEDLFDVDAANGMLAHGSCNPAPPVGEMPFLTANELVYLSVVTSRRVGAYCGKRCNFELQISWSSSLPPEAPRPGERVPAGE